MKYSVVLMLGSNQGDRDFFLTEAARLVSSRIGDVVQLSGVYETEAVGYDSCNRYLNQGICVETQLKPLELLIETQDIEKELGRVRSHTARYTDRTIDIDIIYYSDLVIVEEELVIPHPETPRRGFVLRPLMDIIPCYRDPITGETVTEMYEKVKNILD